MFGEKMRKIEREGESSEERVRANDGRSSRGYIQRAKDTYAVIGKTQEETKEEARGASKETLRQRLEEAFEEACEAREASWTTGEGRGYRR